MEIGSWKTVRTVRDEDEINAKEGTPQNLFVGGCQVIDFKSNFCSPIGNLRKY